MRRGWGTLLRIPMGRNRSQKTPVLEQALHIGRCGLADALSSSPPALGSRAGPGLGGYLAVGNSDVQPVSRVNLFRAPDYFPGVRSLDHRITPLQRCRGVKGLKLLLQAGDLELGEV